MIVAVARVVSVGSMRVNTRAIFPTTWFLAALLAYIVPCLVSSSNTVPLVGFFHRQHSEAELAFRLTIEKINLDKTILPDVALIPVIEHVSEYDCFNVSKRVCLLAEEGIGGVFGPQSAETSNVVNSISRLLELPHLETHWDISTIPPGCMVNLYPDPDVLALALLKVIEDMDWLTFTIIYENNDSLIRMKEVIKAYTKLTPEGHVPFTVWQLGEEEDQRPLLKEIQASSQNRIILDCSVDRILPLLHQAKEVDLLSHYYSYVLTSLDAHTLDYGDLKTIQTNITTLRLVDPVKHGVQAAVHDWVFEEERRGRVLKLNPETVTTEAALMHDAVVLYAKALHGLGQEVGIQQLSCKSTESWIQGFALINYMKMMEIEGMTGRIKLDMTTGRRSFFTLEINELTKNGFRKIGSWDPERGINYTRSKYEMEKDITQAIENKTFIISSRLGEPYLRYKDEEGLEGNDALEGYSMDLIDEISKILKFKYKFVLVPDGQYGSFDKKTKQWNGLIRELRERRADLAICDLTITYERRSAVDFTMPFMTLGISILFTKPPKQSYDLFSFLSPFSVGVWIHVATAYLGVSLIFYFLCRISPYEWENPHPCNKESEESECTFSLHNTLWFSVGSLMGQGCDLLPKAICTRALAGMWWFFVLIMISSYTANLAAFLTMERMDVTITSVEDLAKQSKIKYGVLAGGSSSAFFRNHNDSMYQKMWSVMESTRPSVFVKTNDEGVERVLNGKFGYAFFMESTSIEYQVEQHCTLTQIGSTIDSKGYGIAMPFQFPYRTAISGAVLKLQEQGTLMRLKNKWWKEMHKGKPSCSSLEEPPKTTAELGMANVGGVFLVLILGCLCAFFVALLEFLWNVRKVAREEKISPREAFMLEVKFAIQCYGTTKPVRKAQSETASQDTYVPIDLYENYSEGKIEPDEEKSFSVDNDLNFQIPPQKKTS